MATYSLSGSGTHALTASTTGLEVTITTPSTIGGLGRSNPVARYDQGLIRFSDGTGYWPPVAILGGPQFIPVPANATSIGYALLGGAVVSITEVIGGTVFFSAGGSATLSGLTDVLVALPSDGQLLQWNAAAGKWENATVAGAAFHGAQVHASGTQTATSGVGLVLQFDTVNFDSDSFAALGTPNTRLTVPAGLGGTYLVGGAVSWAVNGTGSRYVDLLKNGAELQRVDGRSPGIGDPFISWSWLAQLAAGDYVEFQAIQTSGGSLATIANSFMHSTLWLARQAG